jgi:hypothetical protein
MNSTSTSAHAAFRKDGAGIPAECFQVSAATRNTGVSASGFPNPFIVLDGMRVESKADWACLREQLRAMI